VANRNNNSPGNTNNNLGFRLSNMFCAACCRLRIATQPANIPTAVLRHAAKYFSKHQKAGSFQGEGLLVFFSNLALLSAFPV